MDNVYSLKILNFEGPLEKLLELIEEKKLEINQVSLALVTQDFLSYIQKLSQELEKDLDKKTYLRILADFIVVASRLIFIKSKYLLNVEDKEEEAEAREFTLRLLWFNQFRPALKIINNLWNINYIFAHPYLWTRRFSFDVFHPGNLKDINQIFLSFKSVFVGFENVVLEEKVLEKKLISLEDKIVELLKILKSIPETKFEEIASYESKADLVVTFLALLHLARERLILLEQKEHFSDIIIKKYE